MPQAAMIVGIVAGIVCYAAVMYKNKKGWDDVLDVWGVHGIGGFTGILLLGLFGTSQVLGENGLFYGNPVFFVKQLAAAIFISVYSFVVTLFILWIISRFTQVKVPETEMESGLDEIELGEIAYPQ